MFPTQTREKLVYKISYKVVTFWKGVKYIRHITVVDARMGRGKSSAAIRYMNQHKDQRSFLYITPYLAEVDRVCELCNFEEPGCDFVSKSIRLKDLMRQKRNIASTHALFTLMDEETLALASENGYSLIVDESLQVIQGVPVSPKDKEMLLTHLISINDNGTVLWVDDNYEGKFDGYKQMADAGTLYYYADTMYEVMNPGRFLPFEEVIVMTYMFDGQLQKAYFDYFGFDYNVIGVEHDQHGYRFSDRPDNPPPMDYSRLIHIVGEGGDTTGEKMNEVGDNRTALSASWFKRRSKAHEEVKRLRKNMRNFFDQKTNSQATTRLWTTFKDYEPWLLGAKNRYASNFLSLNARATNAYRATNCVAYMVNRFVDPNIAKFFSGKNIDIDQDQFALSEMLQFIWRSAIRDNKEITLYIPSRRMRQLLLGWIRDVS